MEQVQFNSCLKIIFQPALLKIRKISRYLAPECYTNNEYTKASEVYSYGLIIYEIITGESLFKDTNNSLHAENIINERYSIEEERIPKIYQELIKKCLSKEPKERPTFSDIIYELENKQEYITEEIKEEKGEKEFEDYKNEHKNQTQEQKQKQKRTKTKNPNKGHGEDNRSSSSDDDRKDKGNDNNGDDDSSGNNSSSSDDEYVEEEEEEGEKKKMI